MVAKTKPTKTFEGEAINPAWEEWDSAPIVEGDSFGEVWDFYEDGPVFVGRYIGTDADIVIGVDDQGVEKTANAHRFLDQNGEKRTVWGSFDMDSKIRDIEPEQLVRIEFLKKLDLKGGRTMRLYKVQAK